MAKLIDAVGAKFGGAEEREKSLKEAFKVSKQISLPSRTINSSAAGF